MELKPARKVKNSSFYRYIDGRKAIGHVDPLLRGLSDPVTNYREKDVVCSTFFTCKACP